MSTITTKDGTQIYYKDWGEGQPVVFSHGWPLSADDWDTQMMFFLNHGYRVIAHDRRGHGQSGAGGAEVDAGHEAVAGVELHARRPAPAARRPGPQVAHDAAAHEMGDQAPDGGGRKARRFDELGPGEGGGLAHDDGQHPLQVQPAQMAGITRPHLRGRAERQGSTTFHGSARSLAGPRRRSKVERVLTRSDG